MKVTAKTNLEAPPHTWTEGLDYELIVCDGYIKLASNEGSLNYTNKVKEDILENFTIENKHREAYYVLKFENETFYNGSRYSANELRFAKLFKTKEEADKKASIVSEKWVEVDVVMIEIKEI